MENDLEERRNAEIEFVSAAYEEEEAWVDASESDSSSCIYRRLRQDDNGDELSIVLRLCMSPKYPSEDQLEVSAKVEEDRTSSRLLKSTYNSLPDLLRSCRETASSMKGEEAVFAVISRADEWIQEEWPKCVAKTESSDPDISSPQQHNSINESPVVLGRRLIYSHHIISKRKRADMKSLASEYDLTGYVKIGWPGLIIIEGLDEDCNSFYDDIRQWAWKYLVVRGEMQEDVSCMKELSARRRFSVFQEVDDMSVVADHCRQVGLESLFRTSLKVYDDSTTPSDDADNASETPYGALIHVDHMNDAKSYRKWLRKVSQDLDLSLLIKLAYNNDDFSKRPTIIVGVIGDHDSVSAMLKRWRTSRVDVDSKGKPCLERMMTIIAEDYLDRNPSSRIDWETTNVDEHVNIEKAELIKLVGSIGGEKWLEQLEPLLLDTMCKATV